MQPRPVRLVPQLVPQLVPDAASHVAPATAAPIAMGSHGSSMAPRMVMGSMGLVSAAVACRKHRKLSGIRSVNANLTRCRAEGEADPLLAEAKAAAEAAKLQLEAATWWQSDNDFGKFGFSSFSVISVCLAVSNKLAIYMLLYFDVVNGSFLYLTMKLGHWWRKQQPLSSRHQAKLRAEADELRKATATAQRKERAVRILGSDEVMGIGLPELMARLQEEGTELTGEQGLALAQAMGFQEEPYFFRLEDLASEAFDKKLSAIQAENVKARQAEAKKREEERANQAANAANAASSTTVSPEMGEVVNDDRSSLETRNNWVVFLCQIQHHYTVLH